GAHSVARRAAVRSRSGPRKQHVSARWRDHCPARLGVAVQREPLCHRLSWSPAAAAAGAALGMPRDRGPDLRRILRAMGNDAATACTLMCELGQRHCFIRSPIGLSCRHGNWGGGKKVHRWEDGPMELRTRTPESSVYTRVANPCGQCGAPIFMPEWSEYL